MLQQTLVTSLWVGLILSCAVLGQVPNGSYVNFEGSQTSPVRLSPQGTRLFAVNTPDARLSVFDIVRPSEPELIAEIPVGIEPVSVNARTEDEVWVVNQVSDSVSIISVSQRIVIDTIQVKDEPSDVVFFGDYAFVSASRSNEVRVFDVRTRTLVKTIPVFGGNPRSMVSTSAGKIYASFALSGNRTTIIPGFAAPRQPAPTNPSLPAPPRVAMIADAEDPAWRWAITYKMPDNDVVEIDARTLTVSRYFSRLGTINLGIAVRPFTGEIYVGNTEARNLTRFEPNLKGRFVENRVTRVRPSTIPSVSVFDLDGGRPTRETSLAQPTSMVFDPLGRFLFVAAFGSDRVAILNPDTGAVLARVAIGPAANGQVDPRSKRGPRGLALHPFTPTLYVMNRISNTLSIVNTTSRTVSREIPVGTFDPTPAVIRAGRGFLYDAKLAGNGSASCAACHIDADMDMLAWDLGDPGGEMSSYTQGSNVLPLHPMKGPMTTQSLRGLAETLPLHWRGDRRDFSDFNGAFESLMGGSKLSTSDMTAFSDFVQTLKYQPNPNQKLDRTLPASFNGGNPTAGALTYRFQPYFQDVKCNTCHSIDPGVGTNGFVQAFQGQDQPMKVPQLRNIYQKTYFNPLRGGESIGGFGLLNDGTMPNLFVLLSQANFASFASDTIKKLNLAAFVMCFDTGMAPAAGYTRTLRKENANDLGLASDWITLQFQAAAGNIDLIVKGTSGGRLTGMLYRPASNDYVPDTAAGLALNRTQLTDLARRGDILTIMGVPPGSGRRMGIDRNLNGVLDQDER